MRVNLCVELNFNIAYNVLKGNQELLAIHRVTLTRRGLSYSDKCAFCFKKRREPLNADAERYRKYLMSDKWKAICKQRYEIDGYRCCMCGCSGTTGNRLEIHHWSYRSLYSEQDRIYQDLATLCHCCHKQIHKAMERTTSPDGRKGWKDNPRIPQIHVFDLGGNTEHKTGGINE